VRQTTFDSISGRALGLRTFAILVSVAGAGTPMLLRGTEEHRIICVRLLHISWRPQTGNWVTCLYMFLEILWTLKALSTEVAFMGLERHVYTNV
jgi:hypothetical protein